MLPEFGTKAWNDFLKEIVKETGPVRHRFYKETVVHRDDMAVHVSGEKPTKLLDRKRPNESEEVKQYRLESWEPVTQADAARVVSVMKRIYNPRLWKWTFPPIEGGGLEGNDLEKYLTGEMPVYRSLMNFMINTFTARHLEDPNSVIFVSPIELPEDDTDLNEPIPRFFGAEDVLKFKDGEFFILGTFGFDQHMDKEILTDIIIIDKEFIRKYKVQRNGDVTFAFELQHGLGIVPCFRTGGIVADTKLPQWYRSHIAGILPHWNKAVQMTSDEDGAIVNHVYPEKWEFTVDCPNKCQKGKKTTTLGDGTKETFNCHVCNGLGKVNTKSPFDVYQINRDSLNVEAPLPTPPFGYGEKELGSVEFLDTKIDKEIQKGYAAVNMDILDKVGENQSGKAKAIDRQETDAFLENYGHHIFTYVLPNTVFLISKWRYNLILSDEEIKAIQPSIAPPVQFDILSISQLTEELKGFGETGISRTFKNGLEIDIIEKRILDPAQKERLKAVINVDVLAGLTDDNLLTLGAAIQPEDKYIHAYAEAVVDELISVDSEYLTLNVVEQREKARELAKQKLFVPLIGVPGSPGDVTGDEKPDIEAEAKARLKGSVGGTQGILQIQASVSAGTTQYEAAVAVLNEIYGFDDAIARKLLGPKRSVNAQPT